MSSCQLSEGLSTSSGLRTVLVVDSVDAAWAEFQNVKEHVRSSARRIIITVTFIIIIREITKRDVTLIHK